MNKIIKQFEKKIKKMNKELEVLWSKYETRDGAYAEIETVSLCRDECESGIHLRVEVRWGYYNAENESNNYQYNRIFYPSIDMLNAMYLEGCMETIVFNEFGD